MPPATTWKPRRPVNIAKSGSSNGQASAPFVLALPDDVRPASPRRAWRCGSSCASNSSVEARRERSSVLKLSFTDQRPGRFDFCRMSTVLALLGERRPRRSPASRRWDRSAAPSLGVDPACAAGSARAWPCARQTASHQRALLSAAARVQSFRCALPSAMPVRRRRSAGPSCARSTPSGSCWRDRAAARPCP